MAGLLHANITCSDSARDSMLSRRRTENGLPWFSQLPTEFAKSTTRRAQRHSQEVERWIELLQHRSLCGEQRAPIWDRDRDQGQVRVHPACEVGRGGGCKDCLQRPAPG